MNEILERIPTAAQAKKQVRNQIDECNRAEAERVMVALKQAIERSEFSVMIEPPFRGLALVLDLRAKGYWVCDRRTGPNESGTEISW